MNLQKMYNNNNIIAELCVKSYLSEVVPEHSVLRGKSIKKVYPASTNGYGDTFSSPLSPCTSPNPPNRADGF